MKVPAIDMLKIRAKDNPDDFEDSLAILCQWIRDHISARTPTTTTAEIRYHEGLFDALSLLATGTIEGYSHWQLLCGPPSSINEQASLMIEEPANTTKH